MIMETTIPFSGTHPQQYLGKVWTHRKTKEGRTTSTLIFCFFVCVPRSPLYLN